MKEIIRQTINYALSKFNKEGKNSFWTIQGQLNIREIYKYIISQKPLGFKFSRPSDFENYLKTNIRKFNLFGKLDLSSRTKVDKFAEAEEIIENFKDSIVAFENAMDTDYVVRTKMGNGRVRIYSSGKLTEAQINELKGAYRIVEGVKYFDVRPCLYKNWKNWDDTKQQASCKEY